MFSGQADQMHSPEPYQTWALLQVDLRKVFLLGAALVPLVSVYSSLSHSPVWSALLPYCPEEMERQQ